MKTAAEHAADSPTTGSSSAGASAPVDELLSEQRGRDLRRLPGLVVDSLTLVWKAAPRQLLAGVLLQAAGALCLAGQLLVTRRLLDKVAGPDGDVSLLGVRSELAALAAMFLVVAIAGLVHREQQRTLAALVEKYTTGQVLNVTTSVGLLQFERPEFFDQLQRARINATSRPVQIANGVIGLIGGVIAIIAVGATLVWIEPFVALLLLVGVAPAVHLNRLAARVMHAHAVRQTAPVRRRTYLYELLSRRETAQEVRAFDSAPYLRGEHDRLLDEEIADLRRTVRQRLWYGVLNALMATAVIVGSVVLLLTFVSGGRLGVADAVVALGGVLVAASRIKALIASGGSLYEGALFLRDFTSFISRSEQAPAAGAPKRTLSHVAVATPRLEPFEILELERVGFTYPSRQQASLSDVTLTIRRGEVIALAGENGSGKTTLAKIIGGLYSPTVGEMHWNGARVGDDDLAALRDQVTVIFQDFSRYFLSAHENIGIGRWSAIDDHPRVRQAAELAGIDATVARLPGGYRTVLGPAFLGGSDLSIGEWQSVALARAHFRDAPLLILDEPTAALDARRDKEIFKLLRQLAEHQAVVLISHRLSSMVAADRILVLDRGTLVDVGPHTELMERGGRYAELFRLQEAGYRRASRKAPA